MSSEYTFTMENTGRSGSIIYVENKNKLVMYWEISGVGKYDILLAPLDLRKWSEPESIKIPPDKQIEILNRLRKWAQDNRIRTDLDSPSNHELDTMSCMWKNCDKRD